MKKYLYILKAEAKTELSSLPNILFGFIGFFMHIYIFLNIWEYTYSDPSSLINGYNMIQMVWYVIITEVIWSITSTRKLCREICNDVKTGNIAYNINKPYSYIGYIISKSLGKVIIKFFVYIILAMLVGYLFLGTFPSLSIGSILITLVSIILAILITIINTVFVGLLSFFIEDANPIYWVYSKLILVLGVVFPIEFFPKAVQGIIKLTPAYASTYAPAKMFVDFNINNFAMVLLVQVIYLLVSYLLCLLLYKKGAKNLSVNNG